MAKRKAKSQADIVAQERRIHSLGQSLRFRNDRRANHFENGAWQHDISAEEARARDAQLLRRMNNATATMRRYSDNMRTSKADKKDAEEYTKSMRNGKWWEAQEIGDRMHNRKYTGYQDASTTRALAAG